MNVAVITTPAAAGCVARVGGADEEGPGTGVDGERVVRTTTTTPATTADAIEPAHRATGCFAARVTASAVRRTESGRCGMAGVRRYRRPSPPVNGLRAVGRTDRR